MGTIQNSFNSVLGTAAAAATAGKHISNQNKEAAVKAAENIDATVDAAKQLGADYDEHKALQDSFKADEKKLDEQFDDLVKNGSPESRLLTAMGDNKAAEEKLTEQKDAVMQKRTEAHSNIEMLQKSLDRLAVERDAKRLQAEIYRNQINSVGNNGKDMGEYKLPWDSDPKSKPISYLGRNKFTGGKK